MQYEKDDPEGCYAALGLTSTSDDGNENQSSAFSAVTVHRNNHLKLLLAAGYLGVGLPMGANPSSSGFIYEHVWRCSPAAGQFKNTRLTSILLLCNRASGLGKSLAESAIKYCKKIPETLARKGAGISGINETLNCCGSVDAGKLQVLKYACKSYAIHSQRCQPLPLMDYQ